MPSSGPLLRFSLYKNTGKTQAWIVISNFDGTNLATIGWFSKWRRYVCFPVADRVFDRNCLMEIVHFIDKQMAERRTANG